MRPRSPPSLPDLPAALRGLAALLRAGLPLSAAVTAWPEHCPPELVGLVKITARRVLLGEDPARALESVAGSLGEGGPALVAIARVHSATGCDAAMLLNELARSIERRASLHRSAATAASGTKLSGRIVAALPIAILPLVPSAGASVIDKRGSLLLLCGAALLLLGGWWMAHLFPPPLQPDDVGELATLAASALRAGVPTRATLELCAGAAVGPIAVELEECARRVRLGADWPAAMRLATHEGLRAMASTMAGAQRLGTPIARDLDLFAERRMARAEAAYDRAAKRAPVLMVLPLTVCILPGYVLLAIGPILRGVSFG